MMWVFAYGSLMWRPGFPWAARRSARLPDFSRAFCRLSFRHRGTPEAPGMVLGLVPGGGCRGVAYGVAPADQLAVTAYLDGREGAGYRRINLPIELEDGPEPETTEALTYVPEPSHPSHVPHLTQSRMVKLIATGIGESGTARDYLRELMAQLHHLGVHEPKLRDLLERVESHAGAEGHPTGAIPGDSETAGGI